MFAFKDKFSIGQRIVLEKMIKTFDLQVKKVNFFFSRLSKYYFINTIDIRPECKLKKF